MYWPNKRCQILFNLVHIAKFCMPHIRTVWNRYLLLSMHRVGQIISSLQISTWLHQVTSRSIYFLSWMLVNGYNWKFLIKWYISKYCLFSTERFPADHIIVCFLLLLVLGECARSWNLHYQAHIAFRTRCTI